jgi:integrase
MDTPPERKKRNRGRGEGSIVRRSDGRWQGAYSHKGKRHFLYGKTRTEVRDKLADIFRDIRTGVYVLPDKGTVGDFMGRWLREVKAPVLRPATLQSYGILIRVHIAPSDLGRKPLQDVTPHDVQAFLAGRRDAGLSPRTVQYLYSIIRQSFGQAHRWALVQRNVALLVDPPRIMRRDVTTLTATQARALLRAVEGERLYPLLVLALGTGMRRGELLGLRWADVDLERGTVTVRASLSRVGGELVRDTTKNDKVRRVSPPASVIAALREHRKAMSAERLQPPSGLVFTTGDARGRGHGGKAIEPRNLLRWYKAALRSAGLPDIRFHDLRHSVATILLEAGVHPRVVMEILGHSAISITMDTYSHVMPHVQRDALGTMDDVLFGS